MGERVTIRPSEISPTNMDGLNKERYARLQPMFDEGLYTSVLPPLILLLDEYTKPGPVLLDGNHRLAHADELGDIPLPAIIYTLGESFIHPDDKKTYIVSDEMYSAAINGEFFLRELGVTTFSEMRRRSLK